MNFFAALTCTIFAWGSEESFKVFLRNFQSAGVISHRTRRTHSNDLFGTNIRGCSGLRCTNQANGILQGGAAVSAAPTKQTAFMCLVGALLGRCTSWSVHLRQVHPLKLVHFLLRWCTWDKCTPWYVGALLALAGGKAERRQVHPWNIIGKTTNISEIIRNFAASIVESKLLDFCNTEASWLYNMTRRGMTDYTSRTNYYLLLHRLFIIYY